MPPEPPHALGPSQDRSAKAAATAATAAIKACESATAACAAEQPSTLEPVSGQAGLRFPGKVILGGQRQSGHNVRGGRAREIQRPSRPDGRRRYGLFGAAPGNLCSAASDWWSNEDSNHGPGWFYLRRATGSVRDRGRGRAEWRAVDTNTALPIVLPHCSDYQTICKYSSNSRAVRPIINNAKCFVDTRGVRE